MEGKQFPFKMGGYVVFDRIGKGGTAEIFLARRQGEGEEAQKVVLKRIHPYLSKIPTFVATLMTEARIMNRINSPFVTKVIEVQAHEDGAFIAMEYVEGVDLNRLLELLSKKKMRIPEVLIFHIMSCLLQGLTVVHEACDESGAPLNLIHLDLSPPNVLVSFAGEVKICDFGVATTSELTRIMSQSGGIGGKIAYMSPEQAAGLLLDHRSDIYSAGIIFWELLSGKKMYSSPDRDEVFQLVLEARHPPLEKGRFQKQEALEQILDKALQKDPAMRYQSAAAFLSDMMVYVSDRGLSLDQLAIKAAVESSLSEEILQLRQERERAISALLPAEDV